MEQLPVFGNAVSVIALWIYGMVFFVNGFFTLGKCDPKGTGTVNVVGGVLNITFAFVLILLSTFAFWQGKIPESAASFFLLIGLLIFHFGVATQVVGWSSIFGIDLKASAWAIIYIAAFLLLYFPLFMRLNMVWFAINSVLWSWAVISFVLVVYEKLSPKTSAWTWIIESIITCFIPATLLFLGYPLP